MAFYGTLKSYQIHNKRSIKPEELRKNNLIAYVLDIDWYNDANYDA
jgi:hypothetical protein